MFISFDKQTFNNIFVYMLTYQIVVQMINLAKRTIWLKDQCYVNRRVLKMLIILIKIILIFWFWIYFKICKGILWGKNHKQRSNMNENVCSSALFSIIIIYKKMNNKLVKNLRNLFQKINDLKWSHLVCCNVDSKPYLGQMKKADFPTWNMTVIVGKTIAKRIIHSVAEKKNETHRNRRSTKKTHNYFPVIIEKTKRNSIFIVYIGTILRVWGIWLLNLVKLFRNWYTQVRWYVCKLFYEKIAIVTSVKME